MTIETKICMSSRASTTANDKFNLYLKFQTRLPPLDNGSNWITVTTQWPDHLFLLRNWLRDRHFHYNLTSKAKRIHHLHIKGSFEDNAGTLYIQPEWVNKRTPPSMLVRVAVLDIVEKQLERYKLKFTKDKEYRPPILQHQLIYIDDVHNNSEEDPQPPKQITSS